jgi:hypothetical protein
MIAVTSKTIATNDWWGKKDSNLRSHKTADLQLARRSFTRLTAAQDDPLPEMRNAEVRKVAGRAVRTEPPNLRQISADDVVPAVVPKI